MRDEFGRLISKKKRKQQVIARNRAVGQITENIAVINALTQGIEYERSPKGHDFKAYRIDPLTGKRKFIGYREIKSSATAPLSDLQKKDKKKHRNYKVIRETFPV